MADKEFLEIRRKALEEAFFADHNEKLLQKLRDKAAKTAQKQSLTGVTGINDDAVLDQVIKVGLCSETVAALYLVPLVEVAWADGEIQAKEREAILRSAAEHGVDTGTVAYALLESWLDHPPQPALLETWKGCVAAVASSLDDHAFAVLRDTMLERARAVADAAGGFLGLSKISAKEQAMLEELAAAFS